MKNIQDEDWLHTLLGEESMFTRHIRPSRFSTTGYVATLKATHSQATESLLEQDFLSLLEFDDAVAGFVTQPFTIKWKDRDGRSRRYTPDVITRPSQRSRKERPTLYEVKPAEVLRRDWLELKPSLRAGIGWAKRHGCRFHVVTDRQIRTPYLANVKFLRGYRTEVLCGTPSAVHEQRRPILQALSCLRSATPSQLLLEITADVDRQRQLIPWIWNLVASKVIAVDLERPLTMNSAIWIPGEKETLEVVRL